MFASPPRSRSRAESFRFHAPKTSRSRRTVALPGFAVAWLRDHRKAQAERRLLLGPAWEDHGVVFDRGDGRPHVPNTVSRGFADMVRREGFPHTRFHDLRHAYATALLVAGIHPKVVSEQLGHGTIGITLDTYSHVLPSMGEQAARAIEAALGGS